MKSINEFYVTAVVADYAAKDFRNQQAGAWYLCHADINKLDDLVIRQLYEDYVRGIDVGNEIGGHELHAFFTWLLEQPLGYDLMATANEGYTILGVSAHDA
jgi:hypothetical protein